MKKDTRINLMKSVVLRQRIDRFKSMWEWDVLSENLAIPLQFIFDNTDLPWNWILCSQRPDITFDIIIKTVSNSAIKWDWCELSQLKIVTFEKFQEFAHFPWDKASITANPHIPIQFILDNSEYQTDWEYISQNPNLMFQHVLDNIDKPWDWHCLSWNRGIESDDIAKHPDLPWDWHTLSYGDNITFQIVLDNLDKPWRWDRFSRYAKITMQNVLEHPEVPWDIYLCRNTNIPLDHIQDMISCFPKEPLLWDDITRRSDVTIEFVVSHLKFPWDMEVLSSHPNITMEHVKTYSILNWNTCSLSENPNIMYEEFQNYYKQQKKYTMFSRETCKAEVEYTTYFNNPNCEYSNLLSFVEETEKEYHEDSDSSHHGFDIYEHIDSMDFWWRNASDSKNVFTVKETDPDLIAYAKKMKTRGKTKNATVS